ncbi:M48 family metallopeptidase [Rubrivivax albus]|uniref:M48 family peptidase n=1 Tax=Rubrivivax albus TaxID=2499835 RepID=A0A3S2UA75_9BURK|nr:M48 family metallopeptidase [Rubrivivax albus]RVT52805.1 M48 family peptidase [Rubrivivax albus]
MTDFRTDARVATPALAHTPGCSCPLHQRRLFTGLIAAGSLAPGAVLAQDGEGVRGDVGKTSRFAKLVPAEQVEQAAAAQYSQMQREAAQQRALAPADHPQVVRLRAIAQRLIPYTLPWNPRARGWKWEVNLIGSKQLNAFCMPGGKIAFYYGILQQLQLTDAEVATIMGHEMAHALREHARERMGKTAATRIGANLLSSLFGLGSAGDALLGMGAQLLTLRFSREDESEADIVGMELAARAGYDPAAGVTLWQKMLEASKGAPPEFMSTHPPGEKRIREIEGKLPKVEGLYARADKPPRNYGPPKKG